MSNVKQCPDCKGWRQEHYGGKCPPCRIKELEQDVERLKVVIKNAADVLKEAHYQKHNPDWECALRILLKTPEVDDE